MPSAKERGHCKGAVRYSARDLQLILDIPSLLHTPSPSKLHENMCLTYSFLHIRYFPFRDKLKALAGLAFGFRFLSLLVPMEVKYSTRHFFLCFTQITVLS